MPPSFVPQAQADAERPKQQENEDFGETEILPPQQFGVPQAGTVRPGSVRPGAVQDGVAQPISIRPERVEHDQAAGQPRIAQETGDIAPWGVTAEEREAAHEAAQEAAREAAREAVPGAQTEHGRHTPYIAAQPVYDVQPLESLVARTEAITAAREEERAREDAEAETPSGQVNQEPNGDENLISAEAARAPLANRNREAAGADAEPAESVEPADSATTNASPNDDAANDAGEATTAFDPLAALAEEEAQEAERMTAAQGVDAELHAAGDGQAQQPTQQPVSFAPAQSQAPVPVPAPAPVPASIPDVNEGAADNDAAGRNAIDDDTVPSQSDIDDDTVLSEPEIDDRTVVSDVASGAVSTATPDAASASIPVPDDSAETGERSSNIDEDPTRTVEETTAFNPLEWFDDDQEELEQSEEPEPSPAESAASAASGEPTATETKPDEETTVIPPATVPATTAAPTTAVPAPVPPTTALPQHDDHAADQQSEKSPSPEEQPTQAIPANQLKPLLAGAAAVAGVAAAGAVAQQASAAESVSKASTSIPKTTAIPLSDATRNLPNNALSNEQTLENPAEETVVIGPSKAAPEPVNTPATEPSADSTTILGNPAEAPNGPVDQQSAQQPAQPQPIQPTGRVARSATSSIAQPESDPSQPTVQSSTRPSILAPTGSAQSKPESALDELAQFAVPDDEDDDLFPMSDRQDHVNGNRAGDAAAETAIFQPQGGAAPTSFAPGAEAQPNQYGGQQYQPYQQYGQPNQYGTGNPAYAGYGNANAAAGPDAGLGAGVPGLPTPNGPNGPQGPAGQNPSNAPKPKRKGRHIAAIVATVICVIAIAAGGGGYFWWTNQQHQTALSACTNAQSEFDKSATTLSSSVTKGKQAVSGTQYDEVKDQNDLTGLSNLVNTTTDDGSSESCNADRTTAELNSSANKFKALAKTNLTLASKIDNAVTALKSSKANKSLADAKSALESTLGKAKELMTSATGNVTDESVLTALQQAISDASTLLQSLTTDSDTSKVTASSLNKAAETLETAMDKVNASVKAKQAADDKTRCQNIAGNYGMWQGSMQLTVNSDCSISMQDAGTPSGSSGAYSYTTNSYKENGDGTITWNLSNNETMTYYPSGKQSPSIKEFVDALGNGETDPTINMPKIETGDGAAYVG